MTMTSYSSGFWTSCMHMLSTIRSSNSRSGNSWATSWATRSQRPSVYFMMLALCTAVILCRPLALAQVKAKRKTRRVPNTEIGLMLMPESGRMVRPPSSPMVSISLRVSGSPSWNSIPA